MRSSFAPRDGFVLAKTPSARQQAARRRLMAICAILGLALASGVIGTLTAQPEHTAAAPFSYFPHS